MNSRAYPGADGHSDHNLVMTIWRMRLKRLPKKEQPIIFDVENIGAHYAVTSGNKLNVFMEIPEECSPNELCSSIKEVVLKAAEENIPKDKDIKNNHGFPVKLFNWWTNVVKLRNMASVQQCT